MVHLLTIMMALLGLTSISNVRVDAFAPGEVPKFIVAASLPGASAQEVEGRVTVPIEEALQEIDGIRHYSSVSIRGQSSTHVELSPDTEAEDSARIERDIRWAVGNISGLPVEMRDEPTITRVVDAEYPLLEIALSGPGSEVAPLAERLEDELRRLETIGRVAVVGLPDREVHVLFQPHVAKGLGVTSGDVTAALRRRNASGAGSGIKSATDRRDVVILGRFESAKDVENTALRFGGSSGLVRVGDVARVVMSRKDVGLAVGTNGESGVSVIPTKTASADLLEARCDIDRVLSNLAVPDSVRISIVNDGSYDIRKRMGIMGQNALIGTFLVGIIVFTFLTPGAALWVCVGVPLVVAGVVTVMPRAGLGFDIVSTLGLVIVLGMLVDDAVVVAERILSKRASGYSAADAAAMGASEVAAPVATAAVTTILAFVPLLSLGGSSGQMVWPLPAMVCIALVFSLLESFTILPAHMGGLRERSDGLGKRAFLVRMEQVYRGLLERSLNRPLAIVASFILGWCLVIVVIAPTMQFVFYPQEGSKGFHIKVRAPAGTPLARTEAILASIQDQVPTIMGSDLLAVTARAGHIESGEIARTTGGTQHQGFVGVFLDLDRRRLNATEWIEHVRDRIVVPDGVDVEYAAVVDGPPILQPIEVYVLGNDDASRIRVAEEVRHVAEEAGGVDVALTDEAAVAELDLNPSHERLAMRQLDVELVVETLQAALEGTIATEIRGASGSMDVRVLYEASHRRDIDALLDAEIRNRRGDLVPLRDVLEPIERRVSPRVTRRDGMRSTTVTGGIDPRSAATPLSIAAAVDEELGLESDGVLIEIGGEAAESIEGLQGLAVAFLISIGLTICVITLMLGSLRDSIVVFAVVPFSVAAVIMTFFAHGMPVSMLSLVGAVGLSGVVVNSSILLIDAVRRAKDRASGVASKDILIEACVGRLRPVVVTSLSTLAGVFPTAYGLGGYDTIVSPVSLALGWGLTFSTAVTLFLVPSLYSLIGSREQLRRSR